MAKEDSDKKQKPAKDAAAGAPKKEPKEAKGGGKDKKGKEAKGAAPAGGRGAVEEGPHLPPRLVDKYRKEVVPALMKDFAYKNPMQVPKVEKIVLNMGLGESIQNPKIIDTAVEELTAIAGQKVVITKAKKSIATFKLRQGMRIGAMVTLRRDRMWEFFDRLVNLALPRVRDFKGISAKAFDGRGNFSMGIREQIIFPEINYDKVDKIKGLNVCIVTTARTDEEGRALLRYLGMPFRTQAGS
jgi:large subunit ribosomal protein L5